MRQVSVLYIICVVCAIDAIIASEIPGHLVETPGHAIYSRTLTLTTQSKLWTCWSNFEHYNFEGLLFRLDAEWPPRFVTFEYQLSARAGLWDASRNYLGDTGMSFDCFVCALFVFCSGTSLHCRNNRRILSSVGGWDMQGFTDSAGYAPWRQRREVPRSDFFKNDESMCIMQGALCCSRWLCV